VGVEVAKIVRPKYDTKHEQMLAQEREYAMWLQDQVESLTRRIDVVRRLSWVKRTTGKPK